MRILIGTFGAFFLISASANVDAQRLKDPPWNSEHISQLPSEIRVAVLAMCPQTPSAGHYFATYFHSQINLHFEHFQCENASRNFCNGSECLHQVYKLTGHHYQLAKSFFGSRND
jgi:hypothetical protein